MDVRLTLTLHVDAFNMVEGGGFTTYDKAGKKLASVALPGFPGGEMTLEGAAAFLVNLYLGYTSLGQQSLLNDLRPFRRTCSCGEPDCEACMLPG